MPSPLRIARTSISEGTCSLKGFVSLRAMDNASFKPSAILLNAFFVIILSPRRFCARFILRRKSFGHSAKIVAFALRQVRSFPLREHGQEKYRDFFPRIECNRSIAVALCCGLQREPFDSPHSWRSRRRPQDAPRGNQSSPQFHPPSFPPLRRSGGRRESRRQYAQLLRNLRSRQSGVDYACSFKNARTRRLKFDEPASASSFVSSWLGLAPARLAPKLVTTDTARHLRPSRRARMTSGTVDMPTRSAPRILAALISAGVSKDGPENHM